MSFRLDIPAPAMSTQQTHEPMHVSVPLNQAPVEPADLVVLTIGVVVASLGAPDLVAHREQRHPQRQHRHCEEVLDLPIADRLYGGIVSWTFNTPVIAPVVIRAITIAFTVGLVVFAIVRD